MTLKEFRNSTTLVAYAKSIFEQENFKLLLEAVRNEHPKNYRPSTRGLLESDHAINLGRVYGFDEFDNTLMSAATFEVEQDTSLLPTFEPVKPE